MNQEQEVRPNPEQETRRGRIGQVVRLITDTYPLTSDWSEEARKLLADETTQRLREIDEDAEVNGNLRSLSIRREEGTLIILRRGIEKAHVSPPAGLAPLVHESSPEIKEGVIRGRALNVLDYSLEYLQEPHAPDEKVGESIAKFIAKKRTRK